MAQRRLGLLCTAILTATACSSGDVKDRRSGAGQSAVDSTAGATATVPWFDGTLPMILVPAHSNDRAFVLMADSLAPDLGEGTLEQDGRLIRLDGSIASVRVAVGSDEACVEAALDPAPSTPWGAGFVGGSASAVRVDSLGGIPRADSARLSPIVFRLASAAAKAAGRFTGLPFSLVDLWRFRTGDGAIVIVAATKRQINQEDSPLEERMLIVAEGDSASANFETVFSSRSTGAEETVEGTEVLGAVTFAPAGNIELILGHDFGGQNAYSILERTGARRWDVRWASRRISC
jgi:hypothetical protein